MPRSRIASQRTVGAATPHKSRFDTPRRYALGSGGSTRKKLAAASGCILEYVGKMACFCGYSDERKRARDYLRWLLKQKAGAVTVDSEGRDDASVVSVPKTSVGFITGHRGEL